MSIKCRCSSLGKIRQFLKGLIFIFRAKKSIWYLWKGLDDVPARLPSSFRHPRGLKTRRMLMLETPLRDAQQAAHKGL